jgi:hypothetical protein
MNVELGDMGKVGEGESPYNVRVTTGDVWDRAARGKSGLQRGKDGDWDVEGRRKSDDSILPLGKNGHGIMRTTEVRVT